MAVLPDDVAADHAALLFVVGVLGAAEGEVAQGSEPGFDAPTRAADRHEPNVVSARVGSASY
ncbi:hypothetical protein OHS59_02220 [Streptomyces sp. NBC_00414]